MSRVVVTGATGTIGQAVCRALGARGDQVVALSRDPERGRAVLGPAATVYGWPDPNGTPPPAQALAGADAVIHLLGEPVAQRWTEDAKRRIRESRTLATRMLVQGLRDSAAAERPAVLVSQSASGYYGPRDDAELDENAPIGGDFLAGVVGSWEAEANAAEPIMRVVLMRTGVVLSPSGGALAKMLPFFRMGVGGPVAGGKQWVPWIHIDDVASALLFCADNDAPSGPVNLVSPNPVDNATLSRALGAVLHRPAILPVPGFALRALYGEMAQIVTTGQRLVPARLLELGFEFAHPQIRPALEDVLSDTGRF